MAILKVRDAEGNVKEILALQGEKGVDGYTPVRGIDYWTDEDIETIHMELIAPVKHDFDGLDGLKDILILEAQNMLDSDLYERTIYLTDTTNEVFGTADDTFSTAIAKMYRHDQESQGDTYAHFPVQIFCKDVAYNAYVHHDDLMNWTCSDLDRVLTESYLRTLLGMAEDGEY